MAATFYILVSNSVPWFIVDLPVWISGCSSLLRWWYNILNPRLEHASDLNGGLTDQGLERLRVNRRQVTKCIDTPTIDQILPLGCYNSAFHPPLVRRRYSDCSPTSRSGFDKHSINSLRKDPHLRLSSAGMQTQMRSDWKDFLLIAIHGPSHFE